MSELFTKIVDIDHCTVDGSGDDESRC